MQFTQTVSGTARSRSPSPGKASLVAAGRRRWSSPPVIQQAHFLSQARTRRSAPPRWVCTSKTLQSRQSRVRLFFQPCQRGWRGWRGSPRSRGGGQVGAFSPPTAQQVGTGQARGHGNARLFSAVGFGISAWASPYGIRLAAVPTELVGRPAKQLPSLSDRFQLPPERS